LIGHPYYISAKIEGLSNSLLAPAMTPLTPVLFPWPCREIFGPSPDPTICDAKLRCGFPLKLEWYAVLSVGFSAIFLIAGSVPLFSGSCTILRKDFKIGELRRPDFTEIGSLVLRDMGGKIT
jgi:hypothetical protein